MEKYYGIAAYHEFLPNLSFRPLTRAISPNGLKELLGFVKREINYFSAANIFDLIVLLLFSL